MCVLLTAALMSGISSNFAAMYQSTIDTVMESYCEDKVCSPVKLLRLIVGVWQERNDGSYMRRYHMTAGLKQLFTQDLSQAAVRHRMIVRC